jgi:hypothetical protein
MHRWLTILGGSSALDEPRGPSGQHVCGPPVLGCRWFGHTAVIERLTSRCLTVMLDANRPPNHSLLGIERMQLLAGPKLGKLGLSPCGRDDVALLPVEGERPLQGGRGLLEVVGEPEDLGEIHQSIGLDV